MIYNPTAGRGRAGRVLDEARRRLPADAELWPTTGPGQAVELATAAARAGFARVVAAGGDGTVHEVANGLLAADDPPVLSVWPLGSMNDYAFTLGLIDWWATGGTVDHLVPLAVDVGRVTAGEKVVHFINGCGVGFNGMVTVESKTVRRLRGSALYTVALLKALVKHFAAPPTTVTTDGVTVTAPLLLLSANLGQREGGFPVTPFARLDDGRFDLLRVGDVWRSELVRHLPGMMTGNMPVDHPKVATARAERVEVRAEYNCCAHADGELVCVPADGVRAVVIELLPGRLRVETFPKAMYGRGRFEKYWRAE